MIQRLCSSLVFMTAALLSAAAATHETPSAAETPMLALIIDDLGYSLEHGRRAIALPGPVTVAVLPFAPHTVNNHTGSLLTTQRAPMVALMRELHVHGLFFLDSRTTPQTVADNVALETGVPCTRC